MLHVGRGCTTVTGDNSVFNPKPSTARGARRHAARNEAKQVSAAKAWERAKSSRPRNYRPQPDKNGRGRGKQTQESFTQQ